MTRDRLEQIAFLASGALAGIGLWFVTGLLLFVAGLSFYSVHLASYSALTLWALCAPVVYVRARKTHPHHIGTRIAPLLIGAGLTLGYFAIAWAITHG